MIKYVFLFLIIYTTTPLAKVQTQYKWVNTTTNLFSGRCFELDSETLGQRYQSKVKTKYCRPKDTIYVFLYKKKGCFEVDTLTRGEKYLYKTKKSHCRTKDVKVFQGTIQKAYGCFEIDSPSNGKNYYMKIKDETCSNLETKYTFIKSKDPTGKCYTTSIEGKLSRVDVRLCKTKETNYTFMKVSNLKGHCIEHDTRGQKYYSNKVRIDKCKPMKTIFVFLKGKSGPGGNCYEIDKASRGGQYTNRVSDKFCK
jgi:hypothetical protein